MKPQALVLHLLILPLEVQARDAFEVDSDVAGPEMLADDMAAAPNPPTGESDPWEFV